MFLKPEQQLERCKRIVRQRVDPHIHPSIAGSTVEVPLTFPESRCPRTVLQRSSIG